MKNVIRKSRWQKLGRISAAVGASAALAFAATGVVGAPPHHPCVGCRVCVDGDCRPNAETYGYYQTQWRIWPKGMVAGTKAEPIKVKLPTQVEPPPAQEDLDNAPRPPLDPKDTGEPIKPTTGDEAPKTDKPNPFEDDPDQSGSKVDPAAGEESPRVEVGGDEMSILVPPRNDDNPTHETAIREATDSLIEDSLIKEAAASEPADESVLNDSVTYDAIDAAPAIREAIRSSYNEQGAGIGSQRPSKEVRLVHEEAAGTKKEVKQVSDEAPLRLVGDEAAAKTARTPAKQATASESGNPLRSGWGARGESSLREPKVVTKFGGTGATNPLRK